MYILKLELYLEKLHFSAVETTFFIWSAIISSQILAFVTEYIIRYLTTKVLPKISAKCGVNNVNGTNNNVIINVEKYEHNTNVRNHINNNNKKNNSSKMSPIAEHGKYYAKTVNLSEILRAIQLGAFLENVWIDLETLEPDYFNTS